MELTFIDSETRGISCQGVPVAGCSSCASYYILVSKIQAIAYNTYSPFIRVVTLSFPTAELLCLGGDTAHEVLTHGLESLEQVSATSYKVGDKERTLSSPSFSDSGIECGSLCMPLCKLGCRKLEANESVLTS